MSSSEGKGNYEKFSGEERRSGIPRRQEDCPACSGIIIGLENVVDKQKVTCNNLRMTQDRFDKKVESMSKDFYDQQHLVEESLDGKVPMKLFYVMIGLIVTILSFQWTTYERVGKIAISHEKTIGMLNTQTREITVALQGNQNLHKIEMIQLKNAQREYQRVADKDIEEIKREMREFKKVKKD